MANSTRRFSAALCAIALIASLGAAQSTSSYKELPNFHKVSDTLYRGAQPLNDAAKKLGELGIKTVINLRGEDEVSLEEKKQAEAAGLRYFSVPMPGLSAPSDEVVARVMSIIDNPENQPVFIHCKRGSDRTGTIAAIYRISHDGWTADRALNEARGYGLSWMEFGMKSYVADYYKKKQNHTNAAEAAAAATTH
jgi:protein tyrosine/serine phosphatase